MTWLRYANIIGYHFNDKNHGKHDRKPLEMKLSGRLILKKNVMRKVDKTLVNDDFYKDFS